MPATPQRCPICEGSGLVVWTNKATAGPFAWAGAQQAATSFVRACHGCEGSGVVWEPDPDLQWMEKAYQDTKEKAQ